MTQCPITTGPVRHAATVGSMAGVATMQGLLPHGRQSAADRLARLALDAPAPRAAGLIPSAPRSSSTPWNCSNPEPSPHVV